MAEVAAGWLSGIAEKLHAPLRRAAAGVPANVALMQILAECGEPGEAEAALRKANQALQRRGDQPAAQKLAACLELLTSNPGAFGVVRKILGGLDHARSPATDDLAYWAAAFDRAARQNPEASVALYALGNPDLLDAATREIVGRLDDWGLLTPETDCLDIGCGIGRFETALGPRLRRVVGIDIAPAMVETARRRTADLPNVEIVPASGRDLAGFADKNFDLVLAVDAFPYIVSASLAGIMLHEAARVLRPRGRLIILNYSYRGDGGADTAEIKALAAEAGLSVRRDGTPEFTLWDGLAFDLEKP